MGIMVLGNELVQEKEHMQIKSSGPKIRTKVDQQSIAKSRPEYHSAIKTRAEQDQYRTKRQDSNSKLCKFPKKFQKSQSNLIMPTSTT